LQGRLIRAGATSIFTPYADSYVDFKRARRPMFNGSCFGGDADRIKVCHRDRHGAIRPAGPDAEGKDHSSG
jgi:hypothetical protein